MLPQYSFQKIFNETISLLSILDPVFFKFNLTELKFLPKEISNSSNLLSII